MMPAAVTPATSTSAQKARDGPGGVRVSAMSRSAFLRFFGSARQASRARAISPFASAFDVPNPGAEGSTNARSAGGSAA